MKNAKDQKLLVHYLRKAGRYEPVEEVAEGAFGLVQIVKDKETQKIYAKKIIPFDPDDVLAPKYFFREFLNLRIFQIDGLPFLKLEGFNFPENGEEAFIVTEYVKGGSLAPLINNMFKDCSDIPTTKMIIIYGIAFAINLLHEQNVVHRDLKPENILLNDNREPILADFGFARLIQNSSVIMTGQLGTLTYMAPELIQNYEIKADKSIDVYAFAVILFQILCGQLKYNNGKDPKHNEKIFKKHIINGYRFDLPGEDILPNNFRQMITECWSQQPIERWPMEEIVKALKTPEFILEGTNLEKFQKYVDRLDAFYENSMKESEEEEIIEYTKPFKFL